MSLPVAAVGLSCLTPFASFRLPVSVQSSWDLLLRLNAHVLVVSLSLGVASALAVSSLLAAQPSCAPSHVSVQAYGALLSHPIPN